MGPPRTIEKEWLRIEPVAEWRRVGSHSSFHDSMQELLLETLSPILEKASPFTGPAELFRLLRSALPIINWTPCDALPCTVSIRMIIPSPGNISNGTGRFLLDNIDRWVFPGANPGILTTRSLDFVFTVDRSLPYFIYEITAAVLTPAEQALLQKILPRLAAEMRLIIQAVFDCRKVVSRHSLSSEEKKRLITGAVESLLHRPQKEFDINVFDQMQHLYAKLSAERNTAEMARAVLPMIKFSPLLFDPDIFYEIQKFVLLFRETFTAPRTPQHLSRIICFQYLFTQKIHADLESDPSSRYFYLKLAPATIQEREGVVPVLGIGIAMNQLSSHELFDESHILSGITSLVCGVETVPGSFLSELRNQKVRLCYIEIRRSDRLAFTAQQIQGLKKKLARDLKHRVQNLVHPLFIPRNEEEILRRILILSQELRYVKDLPQAMILFENQSETEIRFTIIWLRIASNGLPPLEEACRHSRTLSFSGWGRRPAGRLRKRYQKEACVFTATLDKTPFFREDRSLDLNHARQAVVLELTELFGPFRDYNGGILLKQQQILEELKKILGPVASRHQLLLENFFYSLQPTIQQSLISPSILARLFLLLLSSFEQAAEGRDYQLEHAEEPSGSLLAAASLSASTSERKKIAEQLNRLGSSMNLYYSTLEHRGVVCCALIQMESSQNEQQHLLEKVQQIISPLLNAVSA